MRPGRTGMRKAGWPTDRQVRRLTWFGCLLVAVGAVVAIFAVIFHPASHTDASAPARATHPAMERATPVRSASNPPVTWPVAGPVADLSVPLAGMPPVPDPANIYADAGPDMFSPAVRGIPYRIYVPDSGGSTVTVIDPATHRVIATYNMYFTPDGHYAIVVAEARQNLDFRDPHTFALKHRIHVDCAGVDHIDFAATGAYLIATCEFAGRLVRVDLHTLTVAGYLNLPGSAPQDIKLDPAGRIFYAADKNHGGVWLIDAATFRLAGFIPTGPDAHGLYPSRDSRYLYVTNRDNGTITLISFAARKVITTWRIPGGGSPDMGNLSPDGKVFWVSGRYDNVVYAISTANGHLLARIPVGPQPHGLCVWPQPGRYSLGHTGITR